MNELDCMSSNLTTTMVFLWWLNKRSTGSVYQSSLGCIVMIGSTFWTLATSVPAGHKSSTISTAKWTIHGWRLWLIYWAWAVTIAGIMIGIELKPKFEIRDFRPCVDNLPHKWPRTCMIFRFVQGPFPHKQQKHAHIYIFIFLHGMRSQWVSFQCSIIGDMLIEYLSVTIVEPCGRF